jgi:hypothetical protein
MEVRGQLHTSEVLSLQRSIHRNFILYAPLVPQGKKKCVPKIYITYIFRFHSISSNQETALGKTNKKYGQLIKSEITEVI